MEQLAGCREADRGFSMPFFSVIIATRNRPALFNQALASVLNQSLSDIEIIVVNDGSTAEYQIEYEAILKTVSTDRIRYFPLDPNAQGNGQSFVVNFGVSKATAPYICFLDDDDCWTDPNHLSRAQIVITAPGPSVDLYMTNQAGFRNGVKQPGTNWLADLPEVLAKCDNQPDRYGVHNVTVEELLQSRGFCHLNTLIVQRALFDEIGGMEASIRWECDHDLYFRLIDRSVTMKYSPVIVARHNIPDPAKTGSMTTALSEIERRLFQLMVFARAQSLCRHQGIRAYASLHYAYALKRIAEAHASAGQHVEAARYARVALRAGFSLKWGSYTAWRILRALFLRLKPFGTDPRG